MRCEILRAYVEQVLIPELSPGDVVVLDNLAAHKVASVREAVRAAGASLLYLPPASPDLNLIEQIFAKLKALLRESAARTKEALRAIISFLEPLQPIGQAAEMGAPRNDDDSKKVEERKRHLLVETQDTLLKNNPRNKSMGF